MLDFWFTVGAAVANPNLLTLINADMIAQAAQNFPPFTQENITMTVGVAAPVPQPNAGVLDPHATPNIRQKIRDHLVAGFGSITPPISLYTAGKLCQLWKVSNANLVTGLAGAATAFQAANQPGPVPLTAPFLTLMGAALIDSQFSQGLLQQQFLPMAAEFGVTMPSPEWAVFNTWLNHPQFQPAQNALLLGWSACREVMLWYGDFQYAAN